MENTMHPMMRDWLEAFEGPDALEEAQRFIENNLRHRNHPDHIERLRSREFTSRAGYDVVLARAHAIVAAAK